MPITQDERNCKVTSPFGANDLILTGLDAQEQISAPFQYDCRFVSEKNDLDFSQIVGKSVTLALTMAKGGTRHFNGRCVRFAQSDADSTNIVYRARLVPWFYLASRRTNCRIFQNESVIDIFKKVFGDKLYKDLADFDTHLESSYDPIPYCVQYRESDFHFASRILEEAGVAYYFKHSEGAHQMILFDAPSKVVGCPGQSAAAYSSAGPDDKTPGQVTEWRAEHQFRSGSLGLRDFNYRDPSNDLTVNKVTTHAIGGNEAFEIFDYPGEYQAIKEGERVAQLRIEAEECASQSIRGSGTCYGFTPGYKFDLKGHYRESFNASYLLTRVHHSFSEPLASDAEVSADYVSTFRCAPAQLPCRPQRRTPKPIVNGVQTAIVVGEGGKEIDMDDLGCIYVKFHWDREAKNSAGDSCRVRVASSWSGKGWGAFNTPRIGQEVLIEFEEGDPDRPVCTGSVYNGLQKPPYSTGNQSGIKSRSTTGGGAGNFNEVKFDDTKGSEVFSMQAEKDMNVTVKDARTESVGSSQTTTIGDTKKTTVVSDHTEEIGGTMWMTVKQAKNELVYLASSEEVGLWRNLTVGGAYTIEVVAAMNTAVGGAKLTEVGLAHEEVVGLSRTLTTGKKFTVSAGDDIDQTTKKKYTVMADEDTQISTKKRLSMSSDEDAMLVTKKKMKLEATDEIEIKTGDASMKMKSDGKIEVTGKDVTFVSGQGKINIDRGGIITVKGPMVKINP